MITRTDIPPIATARGEFARPPQRSRIDPAAEDAALAFIRRGQRDEALKVLMVAYGPAITAFAHRVVRNTESAKDVRQQVFLDAYQGMRTFEGRSSLWRWLCGIAYHRCLDELKRHRRARTDDDLDVWDELAAPPDPRLDAERVAR